MVTSLEKSQGNALMSIARGQAPYDLFIFEILISVTRLIQKIF